MSTAFVLMATNWEYNDEIYHTGESGDDVGAPTKIFRREEAAQDELLKKSRDFFVGGGGGVLQRGGLGSIAYSEEEVLSSGWKKTLAGSEDELKTAEIMEEEFPDLYDAELPVLAKFISGLSDRRFKVFLNDCYCGAAPFSVQEVELED